jgi:crotonobetainyl-CoA:carnitine CoA-transferase CaiB-like acyl-CoA transferase
MLDDPHLAATDFFHRRTHPTEGEYVEMRLPIEFGVESPREVRPPPGLGDDGAAIRAELGLA